MSSFVVAEPLLEKKYEKFYMMKIEFARKKGSRFFYNHGIYGHLNMYNIVVVDKPHFYLFEPLLNKDETKAVVDISREFHSRTGLYLFKERDWCVCTDREHSTSFYFLNREHFAVFLELIEKYLVKDMCSFDGVVVRLPLSSCYEDEAGNRLVYSLDERHAGALEVVFRGNRKNRYRNRKEFFREYVNFHDDVVSMKKIKVAGKKEAEYFMNEYLFLTGRISLNFRISKKMTEFLEKSLS